MLKSPAELFFSTEQRFVVGQFYCSFFPAESSVSVQKSRGILRSTVRWFSLRTVSYLRQRKHLMLINADGSFVKVL